MPGIRHDLVSALIAMQRKVAIAAVRQWCATAACLRSLSQKATIARLTIARSRAERLLQIWRKASAAERFWRSRRLSVALQAWADFTSRKLSEHAMSARARQIATNRRAARSFFGWCRHVKVLKAAWTILLPWTLKETSSEPIFAHLLDLLSSDENSDDKLWQSCRKLS